MIIDVKETKVREGKHTIAGICASLLDACALVNIGIILLVGEYIALPGFQKLWLNANKTMRELWLVLYLVPYNILCAKSFL